MNLKEQVNKSGFPLQLAIANEVKRNQSNWNVLYEEHLWVNDTTSGFIDLVLEDKNRTWLMNIECKRVQDSTWVFIVDRDNQKKNNIDKLWFTHRDFDNVISLFDWKDVQMSPECHESHFCIVPGQDSKAMPMLERIAASVIQSTEALAKDEADNIHHSYTGLRMYQNLIVTTAELQICKTSVDCIDITTGKLENEPEFTVVPYIRFRKQLGATVSNPLEARDGTAINKMNSQRESTVFIVNSAYLSDFLKKCKLSNASVNEVVFN